MITRKTQILTFIIAFIANQLKRVPKLNKILPPSFERFAREKKRYMIASRPLSFDPAQDRSSVLARQTYGGQGAQSYMMKYSIAYRCMGEGP